MTENISFSSKETFEEKIYDIFKKNSLEMWLDGDKVNKFYNLAVALVETNTRKIGFYVVSMYVLAFFYISGCVAYRIAVFNNILSALNVANGIFMAVFKIDFNVIELIY